MRYKIRNTLSLAAMVLIVAVILVAFNLDAGGRIARMEDLMVSQARTLTDVIAESSLHGLGVYNLLENESAVRLLNNALWAARADSAGSLDTGRLDELTRTMGLSRILLFDRQGVLQAAAPMGGTIELPRELLEPLLTGRRRAQHLGFRTTGPQSHRRHAAAAARAGGGAVVVEVRADSLASTRARLAPGHLIKTLGEGPGLAYVVIQNDQGIQAASTGEVEFPLLADDPHLAPLEAGSKTVSWEYDSPIGPVIEVARYVVLGSRSRALLRVGLDAALLHELRADIRRRTWMRGLLAVASLVLMSSLLLAWQRQRVLDREVVRVTAELREKEEEARRREKLVAMGSLAGGVAHEIRNPLNSIHMISQMLGRMPELPDDVRDEVHHIRDESGRIEQIVQQFLQFAKPRQPVFAPCEVGTVLREVVAVQAAANRAREVRFVADPSTVTAELDRQFLVEILENLLINAVDALQGSGRVEATLAVVGDEIEIVVADDGPGVSPADRGRIFDLYFTTRSEGNGLGLSLCAQMVSTMDGILHLAEEPGLDGEGARFVLRLPIRRRSA